jgi:hypothetical protein
LNKEFFMSGRILTLGALLGALLLTTPNATASRLIPRTLPELTAGSDLIFVGRCEAATPHWNGDRSLILTGYRFRVERALKGSPGATITLDELGGIVNGVGMNVSGVPRYSVGEVVLLFVHKTELGRWETYGAGQGKWQVERDAQGRPWVRSDYYPTELAALRPPGREGAGAPLDAVATRLRNLTLTPSQPRQLEPSP